MKIFMDTSAFYALASRNDTFHHQAKEIFEKISEKSDLITTSYVLIETLALLQNRGGHAVAAQFSDSVREGNWLTILWITEHLHQKGCTLFKTGKKDVSFVDCVSFAAMRQQGIERFFGFDEHFEHAGFIRYT
jgi:predicted nucleic acid-binding protein